jgi:hypothetical protein
MKITSVLFDANNSLLRLSFEGPFSLPVAQSHFIETLDGVATHQARKVLMDGRAVTGEPLLIQRFLYGEFAANSVHDRCGSGLVHAPQFAYVLLEPVLDPRRFGQTVARNRGMNIEVFDNMNEAEHWLELALP